MLNKYGHVKVTAFCNFFRVPCFPQTNKHFLFLCTEEKNVFQLCLFFRNLFLRLIEVTVYHLKIVKRDMFVLLFYFAFIGVDTNFLRNYVNFKNKKIVTFLIAITSI